MTTNKSKYDPSRRVVVTGLGVVSSLGIGWQEFWKNLIAGKSGISPVESFDTSQYDRHMGGEVKNFDPTKFINKKKLKYLGRASQMAIAASKMALDDAKIDLKKIDRRRVGVCVGTTMGEAQNIESMVKESLISRKKLNRILSLFYPAGNLGFNLGSELKLNRNNMVIANACSSGNFAVGYASDLIKSGKVDFVISGGADAFSRIAFTGFSRVLAMAPKKCQPFDKNRKGMLLAEGCGIIILESLNSALKRKAKIYSEFAGYGVSCDAKDMTIASASGVVKSIEKSLSASSIKIDQVDYINAHGTGTKENDLIESKAIHQIFTERMSSIPVSSIKSMLGHSMGAASALETIVCCLVVNQKKIPPVVNLEEFDLECKIEVKRNSIVNVNYVLNNSQAFGGNNSCLIINKISDV